MSMQVKASIERIIIANPDADDDRVRALFIAELEQQTALWPSMRRIIDEVLDLVIDEVRADLAAKRN